MYNIFIRSSLVAGCMFLLLCGVLRISIFGAAINEEAFLSALDAQKEDVKPWPDLRDLELFRIKTSGCDSKGLLFVSNFASRTPFQELSKRLSGNISRLYLGRVVRSFADGNIWQRYISHQIAAKFGLSPDSVWNQKILIVQLDPNCKWIDQKADF